MSKSHQPIPMDCARVIRVIETSLFRKGKGTEDDPDRIVKQYWSFDGELLCETDPYLRERVKDIERSTKP